MDLLLGSLIVASGCSQPTAGGPLQVSFAPFCDDNFLLKRLICSGQSEGLSVSGVGEIVSHRPMRRLVGSLFRFGEDSSGILTEQTISPESI